MKLSITFSLVRCACGNERQAGLPCPSCGRDPNEIDEDLERRRAVVRGASERDAVGGVEPLALEEAFGVLGAWFDGFSEAYEATGEGSVDGAAGRLRESLKELNVLQARASNAPRLRPNHAIWAAVDTVLAAYDDVRDTYLDSLIATTVEEAEAMAARGQVAINSVSSALDRFNNLADAWQSVYDADLAEEHGELMAGAEAIVALGGTTPADPPMFRSAPGVSWRAGDTIPLGGEDAASARRP